jgi:hypothetical protein
MKCIKCEIEIKRCKKDGVLKGGVELIGYAHHESAFNMGKTWHSDELHLVICDKCLSAFSKKPITLHDSKQKIVKGMTN